MTTAALRRDPTEMSGPDRWDAAAVATEPHLLAKLALTGGLLLVAGLVATVLPGRSKGLEFLLFVYLVGAAPALAALLLLGEARLRARFDPWSAVRLFLGLALLGVLGLGLLELASESPLESRWPFLAVIAASAAATALLYASGRAGLAGRPGLSDPLLVALLVLVVVLFSPLDPEGLGPAGRVPQLIDYLLKTPGFAWWWTLALVFVGAALWLARMENRNGIVHGRWRDALLLLTFGLFVLSLFNDDLYINLRHYLPYVGAAVHAGHGGTAMVEVFCQYGLVPWVLIKAAFSAIAPTFGTASLVVRLSMLAYLSCMTLVLFAISRRRFSALLLMAPALIVAITFHPGLYDLNALPSTTGMRYLVPALMVLLLAVGGTAASSRWPSMALLVLASLWSTESFVYTLAPWGYLLFLETLRSRSIRRTGSVLLLAVAAVLVAHLLFTFATYLTSGEWVDYRSYLGLFGAFRPDQQGHWARLADANFAVWVPVWLGHFLVLATALHRALRGLEPSDDATRLAPVAAFGLAALAYFVGRSTWPSLGLAFLPMAVVMIHALQQLSIAPRRLGALGLAALAALTVTSATWVAFGVERLARPPLYDQGNRSLLRRCFTEEGCRLTEVPGRLIRTLFASPLDPLGPAYRELHETHFNNKPPALRQIDREGYRRSKELAAILLEVAPSEARVDVLADSYAMPYIGALALMETGKWHRWPFSNPENDEMSPGVEALILDQAARAPIADGQPLVVAEGFEKLVNIEERVLDLVRRRCHLELLERREFHSVYRMSGCVPIAPSE